MVAIPDAGTISGNITVCVGATTPYTSNGLSGGTWSSDAPAVASVDATTGVVTGVTAGTATIKYTFTNSCGSDNSTQAITVNPLPNAGVVSGAASVCEGAQTTFTSNGLITGGTWSSSNPAAATVGSTTGIVTGVAAGTATITYTSTTPCGTTTASANITVNPLLTTGIVSGSSAVCTGNTTTYTSNGSAGGTWSSDAPSVATVNATTGVVTGVSTGSATITYTVSSGCGTFSANKVISVSPAANPGVLSGSSTVCTGTSVTFTRTGGVSGGSWSSSNPSVATVSGSGVVTGVSLGTAVISYTVNIACGSSSATKSITVTTSASVTASNITVSTDPNACSASVTLGPNITVGGSPTSVQYRIGILWFSFPIAQTHTFFRGTTPVTVLATNSCGTAVSIFFVTVIDNQAPVVTCKPNATRSVNGNSGRYSVRGQEFNATASDGCGVSSLIYSLSGATVVPFSSGNRSLSNERFNIGTTTITWRATDVNGNVSTCTTQVTVTGNGSRAASPFTVTVAPNPATYYSTFQFKSESNENMKIVVYDVNRRMIEQRPVVIANSTIRLGEGYMPGVYFVEIMQGTQMHVVKLIKTRN